MKVQPRLRVRSAVRGIVGRRTLKKTQVERVAKRVLSTRRKIPLMKIKALQQRLTMKVLALKKKLKLSNPKFKRLVKRSRSLLRSGLTRVTSRLQSKVIKTSNVFNDIVEQQNQLYNWEYKTLISETTDGGVVSKAGRAGIKKSSAGWSGWKTVKVGKTVKTVHPDGSTSWTETSTGPVSSWYNFD
uniref:N-acetylmuramoyl-L-alanine amidase n=1 Tax=Macrostomum lignano TaxID=282301 RepID=A0A1I8JLP0_9PLAT